jgi:hypothetical protein
MSSFMSNSCILAHLSTALPVVTEIERCLCNDQDLRDEELPKVNTERVHRELNRSTICQFTAKGQR